MRITRTSTGYRIDLTSANVDDILAQSSAIEDDTIFGKMVNELRVQAEMDLIEDDEDSDD